MSFVGSIIGAILRPMLEQQARKRTMQELAQSLEHSGEKTAARLQRAAGTAHNREIANHIVGIERWGQRRLRVATGEPFVMDRYRSYRLPEHTDLQGLRSAFISTRRETVRLARMLDGTSVSPTMKIRHNDFGELSIKGWFAYLDGHAKRESSRPKEL